MAKLTQTDPPPPAQCTRGADRRSNKVASLPPFHSRAGAIPAERRSPLDRRANWIREFAIDAADCNFPKMEP